MILPQMILPNPASPRLSGESPRTSLTIRDLARLVVFCMAHYRNHEGGPQWEDTGLLPAKKTLEPLVAATE